MFWPGIDGIGTSDCVLDAAVELGTKREIAIKT